jgi:hypothetical protein
MYYMNNVPQRYSLNPAITPDYKYMVQLPVMSSFHLSMSNNALSLTDIILYNEEINAPTTPFYSLEDQRAFLNNFKNNNYFNNNFNLSLGGVGFSIKDIFFTIDGTLKNNMHVSYPKEVVEVLFTGNADHPDIDLSGMNMDMTSMMETGISASKSINEKLRVGVRPKILNGLFTMHTRNNSNRLESDVEAIKVKAGMEARIAFPNIDGLDVATGENGMVDFEETSMEGDLTAGSILKAAYSNFGVGIDLGAHYKITPEIEASLSITDLGFIRWKGESYNYQIDGEYEFTGVEVNTDTSETVDYIEEMKESFNIRAENAPFTQSLHPKIYIGGHYFLPRGFDVGFVSKTSFYYRSVIESLTLFGKWEPKDGISLSLGYNITKNNWSSLSMGFAYRMGFMNGFILTESIPFRYDRVHLPESGSPFDSVLLPVGLQNINIRFGFNILIGRVSQRIEQTEVEIGG